MNAREFLQFFPGFCIQTFDDQKENKDGSLSICDKPSNFSKEKIKALNEQGAGIYFTPNRFPTGRRGKKDPALCTGVNAWYVENDEFDKETQLTNLHNAPIKPSFIVESKNSLHAYWLAKNAKKENFEKVGERLVAYFTGDPACNEISRVLRVPDFYHNKDRTHPFLVKVLESNPERRYDEEEMLNAFPPLPETPKTENKRSFDKNDFWQILGSLDNKMVLVRLSGQQIVNHEQITFKKRSPNGEYIYVNKEMCDGWLDEKRMIGSGKRGGPTWIQWLGYYGRTKAEIAQWAKENLIDLLPEEVKNIDGKPIKVQTALEYLAEIENDFNAEKSPFTWGNDYLDRKLPIIEPGSFVVAYGQQGCLDRSSFVNFQIRDSVSGQVLNHKGGTIEHLYERFNNITGVGRCEHLRTKKEVSYFVPSVVENEIVMQNRVFDVVKCGLKNCYEVATLSGKRLTCTEDHKFYIGKGKYRPLSELSPGDKIFVYDKKFQAIKKAEKRVEYAEVLVKYYPTKHKKIIEGKYIFYRAKKSHLVWAANQNSMEYEELVDFLNTHSHADIDKLKIVPGGYDVHHINEDRRDDRLENLQLIEKKEHYRRHAIKKHEQILRMATCDTISRIDCVGERETYDIKCFHPYNNFVANGIIVHNSGKTLFCSWVAKQNAERMTGVFFLSLEMSKKQIFQRYILQRAGVNKENYRIRNFDKTIASKFLPEIEKINFVGIDEGEIYDVEKIDKLISSRKTSILFIDNLNKIKGKGSSEIELTQSVVAGILNLTRKYKIPIILIHHANKPPEKERAKNIYNFRGLGGMRGTNKTSDDADIIVEISRPKLDFDCPVKENTTHIASYKDRMFDTKVVAMIHFDKGNFYDEESKLLNETAETFGGHIVPIF